jgi:nucleoid DNA-binding protein
MTNSKFYIETNKNTKGIVKAELVLAIETMLGIIREAMVNGEEVMLLNFGKFYIKEGTERVKYNPHLGKNIIEPKRKFIRFQFCKRIDKSIKRKFRVEENNG